MGKRILILWLVVCMLLSVGCSAAMTTQQKPKSANAPATENSVESPKTTASAGRMLLVVTDLSTDAYDSDAEFVWETASYFELGEEEFDTFRLITSASYDDVRSIVKDVTNDGCKDVIVYIEQFTLDGNADLAVNYPDVHFYTFEWNKDGSAAEAEGIYDGEEDDEGYDDEEFFEEEDDDLYPDPVAPGKVRREFYFMRDDSYSTGYAESRRFVNGVAWCLVQKTTSNKRYLAVIAKNGKILNWIDCGHFRSYNQNLIGTPFWNGFGAAYDYDLPGYVIVNRYGKIISDCLDADTYFVGHASDGTMIIKKKVSGFAQNEWHYYATDDGINLQEVAVTSPNDSGNLAGAPKDPFLRRLADGVYCSADGECLINLKQGLLINLSDGAYKANTDESLIGKAEWANDDFVFFELSEHLGMSYLPKYYVRIPADLVQNITSTEDLIQLTEREGIVSFKVAEDGHYQQDYFFKSWSGGSFYHEEDGRRTYVDFEGNLLVSYPTFQDGIHWWGVTDFIDGYSAIFLRGLDNRTYVTLINADGEMQYDPVLCPEEAPFCNMAVSCSTIYKGYVFMQCSCGNFILNPQGQYVEPGDDLRALKDASLVLSSLGLLSVSDGMIFDFSGEHGRLVSVSGNVEIDRAYFDVTQND